MKLCQHCATHRDTGKAIVRHLATLREKNSKFFQVPKSPRRERGRNFSKSQRLYRRGEGISESIFLHFFIILSYYSSYFLHISSQFLHTVFPHIFLYINFSQENVRLDVGSLYRGRELRNLYTEGEFGISPSTRASIEGESSKFFQVPEPLQIRGRSRIYFIHFFI